MQVVLRTGLTGFILSLCLLRQGVMRQPQSRVFEEYAKRTGTEIPI